MQENNLWITITKSRPLSGCKIDMDGCEFYSVDAFAPLEASAGVESIPKVINQVKAALLDARLELAEVILCAKFSPEEWIDQTEAYEPLQNLALKALETGAIVFSGFRSEEIQEMYQYSHTVQELDDYENGLAST